MNSPDPLFVTAVVFVVLGWLLGRWYERRERWEQLRRRRAVITWRRLQERWWAEMAARYILADRAALEADVRDRTGRRVEMLSPVGVLLRTRSFPTAARRS